MKSWRPILATLALATLALATASAQDFYPEGSRARPSDPAERNLTKIVYLLNRMAAASGASAPSGLAVTSITPNPAGTATLPARASRGGVALINTDPAVTIYYGPTTGVNASTGFPLAPGTSQSLPYNGALFFFAASGTPSVRAVETYVP